MYTLVHDAGLRRGLMAEAPSLILSIFVAEMFFKFHSFTLECAAFLAIWFVISYVFSLVRRFWPARQKGEPKLLRTKQSPIVIDGN